MKRRSPLWVIGLAVVLVFGSALPSMASSHREAPLIAEDPVADVTDVYAFRSPDATDTVTLIANYLPFEEPAGGPNFYRFGDSVLYEFHVYNNRNHTEDITYQFKFRTTILNKKTFLYNTGPIESLSDPDYNVRQTYTVTRVRKGQKEVLARNVPTPPNNVGPKSTPNYEALAESAVTTLPGGIRVFAGQRDDPFFADIGALFDLLTIRRPPGNEGGGVDGLGGFNVQTIALQVPIEQLTSTGSIPTSTTASTSVIGVWASASRRQTTVLRSTGSPLRGGPYVQVSRLGQPLINEVINPLCVKDPWNRVRPPGDTAFLPYYRDPEPARLIEAIYGIDVPAAPRGDIVALLAQGVDLRPLGIPFSNRAGGPGTADVLRLNVAVPPVTEGDGGFSRFGILGNDLGGYPNGRRLADDSTDIELRALAGATPFTPEFNVAPNNQLGDGVDSNDRPFLDSFPYVATPWSGFDHSHHSGD